MIFVIIKFNLVIVENMPVLAFHKCLITKYKKEGEVRMLRKKRKNVAIFVGISMFMLASCKTENAARTNTSEATLIPSQEAITS